MKPSRKQLALIRALYTRHGRKKSGRCICEGIRCCSEIYQSRPELVEFSVATAAAAARNTNPGERFLVSETDFAALAATVNAQGVLAVVRPPAPPLPTDRPADSFILALDQVGDPGNFGTIVRTAKAAGLTEIWYTAGAVDPYNDKVIRSALAAQFLLKLRQFSDLPALCAQAAQFGFPTVYLTDPHRGENCFQQSALYCRSVVVIGSEGNGVTPLPGGIPVTIPMPGKFESLNAAQAATIFIFEYVRRQFQ